MTFTRGIFAFALVMLAIGILGSRYLASFLFGDLGGPPVARVVATSSHHKVAQKIATTPVHRIERAAGARGRHAPFPAVTGRVAHVTRRVVAPAQGTRPVVARRMSAPPLHSVPSRHVPMPTAPLRPVGGAGQPAAPGVQPAPVSAPSTGTVSLSRYWVGSMQARRGNTIEVGYVINNPTGHPARVLLGASLKSSRALGWNTSAVNDPAHDVVAIVPPGVSTHIRFFTLPSVLRPGRYDVAWGLRNSHTGQREALVVAQNALKATR